MELYDDEEDMTDEALKKLIKDMDEGEATDMKNRASGVTISIGIQPGVDQEVAKAAKESAKESDSEDLKKELGL